MKFISTLVSFIIKTTLIIVALVVALEVIDARGTGWGRYLSTENLTE